MVEDGEEVFMSGGIELTVLPDDGFVTIELWSSERPEDGGLTLAVAATRAEAVAAAKQRLESLARMIGGDDGS
jgi:hypothetical protein